MSEIFHLPDNFIGREDRGKLESFGGHVIAHGRATRWHWTADEQGNDVFQIYKGGVDEVLAYDISRDRKRDLFLVHDHRGQEVLAGDLEHVMAGLEKILATEHGESPA